jgi:opacity protein-like surface antigen
MKIKKIQAILIIIMVCLSAVSAAAQDRGTFYVGGSFSLIDATIIDQFTRYSSGNLMEKNTFEDEYNGQAYGFYFGYRLIDKKRIFVNVQTHGIFFNKDFNIETSNSTVRRNLFCSRGIDLQPGYSITDNLFFFVNFSVERGRFQFSKKGTSTTYDVDIPVMGYGFGMGLGYQVFPYVNVRLTYKFVQYGSTEISTTLGDLGEKIDVVELVPRYDFIMLGIQYDFGKK